MTQTGRPLLQTTLACLATYALALGLRLLEAPLWDDTFKVFGQPLQSSNDAYFWLAGAKNLGPATGQAMSRLAAFLARISGASLDQVGFWTPPFVAALVAPLMVLWGRVLGNLWAGLCAGVLVAWAPTFVSRTRLGFYDTDMVALLAPLLLGVLLACWLKRLRRGETTPLWLPLAAALVVVGFAPWHRLLPLLFAAQLVVAALCAFFLTPKDKRKRLLPGAALALGLVALLVVAGVLPETVTWMGHILDKSASRSVPGGPVYPPMAASIEEAAPFGMRASLAGLHPWTGVDILGFLGFALVLARRPEALLLLPLVVLGALFPFLGGRVVMFAAPAAFLGLMLRSSWLAPKNAGLAAGPAICVALLLVLAAPLFLEGLAMRPQPALSKEFAEALLRLRELTPTNARLWTWWDSGHAARYYAEREPFADGGKQGPEYVYLLGQTLGATSQAHAAAVMEYTAAQNFAPWNTWQNKTGAQAQHLVSRLEYPQKIPQDMPPQYLILGADALQGLQPLLYFSTWNLDGMQEPHPRTYDASSIASLDLERGQARLLQGETLPLGRLYLYDDTEVVRASYAREKTEGVYCLALAPQADVRVLADAEACDRLALRLLLDTPPKPDVPSAFELVLDAAPHVRVYALGNNTLKDH